MEEGQFSMELVYRPLKLLDTCLWRGKWAYWHRMKTGVCALSGSAASEFAQAVSVKLAPL